VVVTLEEEPRILAVIPTLNDDPEDTIESIKAQDVKVSKIFIGVGSRKLFKELISKTSQNVEFVYVKLDFRQSSGARIGHTINTALAGAKLEDYDYLLRVDADTTLPRHFLTANLKVKADMVGRFGFAVLLKTYPFIKLLKGRWPELFGEDTYVVQTYLSNGYRVMNYALSPILKRKSGAFYSWQEQYLRGVSYYKLGYEPLHAFGLSVDVISNRKNLFVFLGYTGSIMRRMKQYEFARSIFKMQIHQLVERRKVALMFAEVMRR
jgi:hypothetical protein